MLPSAYADSKLGPVAGSDALTVIRLDQSLSHLHAASVPVTNSVTGPPAAVAVTPDGRFAVVEETEVQRPANKPDVIMTDLAPGRKLTVVDLSNPDKPRVVQQIDSHETCRLRLHQCRRHLGCRRLRAGVAHAGSARALPLS